MRVLRVVVCLVVVAVTALPLLAAEVQVEEDAVRVSGFASGAAVAWVVVSDESRTHRKIVTDAVTAMADASGSSRIATGAAASPHALWVAVDLSNGSIAAATRAHGPVAIAVEAASPGAGRQLTRGSSHLKLLLVRPGVGAWLQTTEDGGADDADSLPNGQVTLAVSQFAPLGGSPASAQSLRAGDLAIAADLQTLTVTALRFR